MRPITVIPSPLVSLIPSGVPGVEGSQPPLGLFAPEMANNAPIPEKVQATAWPE